MLNAPLSSPQKKTENCRFSLAETWYFSGAVAIVVFYIFFGYTSYGMNTIEYVVSNNSEETLVHTLTRYLFSFHIFVVLSFS